MKTKRQLRIMLEDWAKKCGLKDEPEIEDLEDAYTKFKKILKQFCTRPTHTAGGTEIKGGK